MVTNAGQSQVAAHSILQTITHLTFVAFPLGLSTAATIRVGNLVGGNNPSQARLAGELHVMSIWGCSHYQSNMTFEGLASPDQAILLRLTRTGCLALCC